MEGGGGKKGLFQDLRGKGSRVLRQTAPSSFREDGEDTCDELSY